MLIFGVKLDSKRVFFFSFFPQTLFLIGNCEVVVGGGGIRIEVENFFPAENGFIPKIVLSSLDAEGELIVLNTAGTVGEEKA